MTKTRWSLGLAYGCLAGATGALAFGLLEAGAWQLSLLVLALGLVGALGGAYRWRWSPALILFLYCVAAAALFWLDTWPGWPLLGLVGALAAGDLFHFDWRMRTGMIAGDAGLLEYRHLRRLGVVLGIGTALYLVAWATQIQLSFGLALLLGLTAVLGISLGLRARRRAQP
jgi:hypothetical protein